MPETPGKSLAAFLRALQNDATQTGDAAHQPGPGGDASLHFSPSKLKSRISETMIRSHLEQFSLGGFEDSLDIGQIQHLASTFSPSKPRGESMSRFDLMAFLEQSNLTLRDSLFHPQNTNMGMDNKPSTERVTFAGALSDNSASGGPSGSTGLRQEQPMDLTSSREASVVTSHPERPENSTSGTASGGIGVTDVTSLTATHVNNEVDYLIPPPSVGPISDLDWTEEMDQVILSVVTVEGVNSQAVAKILKKITGRSASEIHSRAEDLIQWINDQPDTTDTESEYGN